MHPAIFLMLCAQGMCIKSPANDFYFLALTYNDTLAEFTIHGLWPQTDLYTYPSYCKEVEFNMTALDPLIEDLKKFWPSDKGSDEDFYRHEWSKHGSCTFKPLTELEYFSNALDLYQIAWAFNMFRSYCKTESTCLLPVARDFFFDFSGSSSATTLTNKKLQHSI